MDEQQLARGKALLDAPAAGVARLSLSSPESRITLDPDILASLAETLSRLDRATDVRCLIIAGADRSFSGTPTAPQRGPERLRPPQTRLLREAIEALTAFSDPLIAAINGPCFDDGLELVMRCDLRICAADAEFGMPGAKLGWIYDPSGLRRLIDVLGVARARELVFTGRKVAADRAAELGLVHTMYPPEDLAGATVGLAREVASKGPALTRGNKKAIDALASFPRVAKVQDGT